MTEKPNEVVSALPNSVIDYLHNVPGREVEKAIRIAITDSCRDADYIPKVKDAGEVKTNKDGDTYQVMHNGLKVSTDGYYGSWVTDSIKSLNGHHEPQEEKVFYEVSEYFEPNTWMIELGSYWSYYSLWFHKVVPGAKNICCEPDPENKKVGIKNAQLNNFKDMFFVDAAAGDDDGKIISFDAEHVDEPVVVPVRTVDSLVKEYDIPRLEVLHMDVQGFELDALHGALNSIKNGIVRFVFISTHHYLISRNPNIHQDCIDFIKKNNGHIIAEHDIHESFSGDGLIVASFFPQDSALSVEVSRNRMVGNQFRAYTKDLQLTFEAYEHILRKLVRHSNEIGKLREENVRLGNDLEYLNNLHIPGATRQLIKAVYRSLKFRAVSLIWGDGYRYDSTPDLMHWSSAEIKNKAEMEQAIKAIQDSDSANLKRLMGGPSRMRLAVYEGMRKASHAPRYLKRSIRKIKG